MYKHIRILVFMCVFVFPLWAQGSESSKNLFVIVTTDDPITQLMSMVLATQSTKKGAHVDVLLCGEAGALAVKNSPEVFLKPNNKSPQMLLKSLINNGVKVEICPPYLPNKGKGLADMVEGVAVAKPPNVADKLLHENTIILSY